MVASDATATSRAAIAGSSDMAISWLKPIGRTSGSIAFPIRPAIEYSMAGRSASAGGAGKLASAHSAIVTPRMMVPARFRKALALSHRPTITSRKDGI